ncbi:MAG TPA: penicillin-binding transpeptidase domain-containing protein [Mycobacteriales bacterium]|nr:penicillin-binding transpeptidase domain-containing protein [Mycobacteriales bacterium]
MPLTPSGTSRYYGGRRRTQVRRRRVAVGTAAVVVVAALGSVLVVRHRHQVAAAHRSQREAEQVVATYLAAMSKGDAAGAAAVVEPAQRAGARALLAASLEQLDVASATYRATSPVRSTGKAPGASFHAALVLRGLGDFSFDDALPLVKVAGHWAVDFSPAVVHPKLTAGGSFVRDRHLGKAGRVLTKDGTSMLAADDDLASNLRGQVTTLTSDDEAHQLGPLFLKGDDAGTTGLERGLSAQLQGTPGGSIGIKDKTGHVTTLKEYALTDGHDVTTTLDIRVQHAGEAAMGPVTNPGALVALDAQTGSVLALVNHPKGGLGRAIAVPYPPGSTFKIVTSTAALMAGIPAGQVLSCTPTATIDGRTFHNAEHESFGSQTFTQAFATSCNTWFVQLADKVYSTHKDALTQAAQLYGFAPTQAAAGGVLPLTSFGGYYPPPKDGAAAAGQAIGQDEVLASPLQMASVAAAVASGTWHSPHVTDDATVTTHALPAGVAATLRTFMAAVEQGNGTAAHVGLPAGTYGKTGTAETTASASDPKKTDSWFVGFRGTIAFAVEVDEAGFGADVAAPAAARFLAALGG